MRAMERSCVYVTKQTINALLLIELQWSPKMTVHVMTLIPTCAANDDTQTRACFVRFATRNSMQMLCVQLSLHLACVTDKAKLTKA